MTRTTRGAAVALILMLASAPSAMADDPTGGTTVQSTSTTSTTPGAPTPTDGSTPSATPTSPSAVSPTQTVKLTRSQTKQVQRRVHVRADGAVGARTRVAIRRYQGKKRLTRTGRPNLETIKAMKLSFASQVERKLSTSSGTTSTDRQAPVSGDVATAIAAARTAIGTPYQNGGTTTSGFDCSGLVVWAFGKAGAKLPRTSFEQYEVGTPVEQADIQPGDLVFFSTAGPGASHVGIATSATTVISATTKGVMEHQLDDDYWGSAYVGARRVAAS